MQEPKSGMTTDNSGPRTVNRREMLIQALMAAVVLPQAFGQRGEWGGKQRRTVDPSQIPAYKFKTLPVSRFPEMQAEYAKVLAGSQFTNAKAFRDETAKLSFKLPADFTGARSVVVVAAFTKSMYVNFNLNGSQLRVLVPPQYYADDTGARMKTIVQNEIVKNKTSRIVDVSKSTPLKLLAARSGLGQYARNNLIFVDGMGSYLLLYAFLTDYNFGEDSWTQLSVMNRCNHCDRCARSCPTSCISETGFPITIDKCVTLYNERPGAFPNWMMRSSHNALMGCIRCQDSCPEDGGYSSVNGTLEDISAEETQQILKGISNDVLLKTLQRKLKQFPGTQSKEAFPILARNLSVLTRA